MSTQPWLPDSDLDGVDLEFAHRIRTFCRDKLLPHARIVDEQRTFRRETVHDLGAAGILGGPLPREAGGSAWTPMQLAIAHEEMGAVCGNARGFCAVQTGLVAQCLNKYGAEAQKGRWLPGLVSGATIGALRSPSRMQAATWPRCSCAPNRAAPDSCCAAPNTGSPTAAWRT